MSAQLGVAQLGSLALGDSSSGSNPFLPSPPPATLSLAGGTPVAYLNTLLPHAGTLALAGAAVTLRLTLPLGAGAVALSGGTPDVSLEKFFPGAGTIHFTGGSVHLLNQPIQPGAGTLTLTGAAVTVARRLSPGHAFLNLNGALPVLALAADFFPGAGTLLYLGKSPVVSPVRSDSDGIGLFIGDVLYNPKVE